MNQDAFDNASVAVPVATETNGSQDDISRLTKIVSDELGFNTDQIHLESHLINDLGADSLDIIGITHEIEQEFNIQVESEEVAEAQTISQLSSLVQSKKVG